MLKRSNNKYSFVKENISVNVRKYRKSRKMTQEELAEKADISYDFMRRIESSYGKCGFSVITLYKLAEALGVGMDDLARESNKNYNEE